jgi:hypothetical protein
MRGPRQWAAAHRQRSFRRSHKLRTYLDNL